MKKIKEGLINEEIVRRYPGFDNGGNNIVDKGKGSGSRSHIYGSVITEELGDLDASMSGVGRMIGVSSQVLWGTRQGDIRQQRRKKSWWRRVINLI